ncbi:unnamed protein product [Schistosoma margrebowiei]|uniref:Uncharacterized protein n=3 Tax=Schistosoma margrebowiei TaxID=48269 RepID=A0AA84ZJ52_9TREM|nr:unnamed protein product [Schistosoma margrebowiei]CAH8460972.1 unnamed protein product [Schistosoma margrebowiei]
MMESRKFKPFDTVINFNEDFISDSEVHIKTSSSKYGFCSYPGTKEEKESQSLNSTAALGSFVQGRDRSRKLLNSNVNTNLQSPEKKNLFQNSCFPSEPLKFIGYRPIFGSANYIDLCSFDDHNRLKPFELSFLCVPLFSSSTHSYYSDERICNTTKQTMLVSSSFTNKPKKGRVRSLSELSLQHVYHKGKSETEAGVHSSCNHYEKELNYLRQELMARNEEAEKIAHELMHAKNEEKQFGGHLRELTKEGSAKTDTINKLKEKVSELYVEVESLRHSHQQAICHQEDLQKEIDILKCSRDWYANQLRSVQCVSDRVQNEPERIVNLLKDSSEMNHRLAHENACLRAQLVCSKAALADAKRNLSRQLESIRVDMVEREALFERITAERALFENISRQRADEIRELQTQVSNFQMELKATEEHILLQKNKLLDAEGALAVAERKRSELQNQLESFEREHFTKENYLDDQFSKYGIILESLKVYENGDKSKGILIDEILEEKATLTAALSASQYEKETLNKYLVNLKDNLFRVEKSFVILRREIESKSAQIMELTTQRDSMADKIKFLSDQLSDYWNVIEKLRQEKEKLNSSLKVSLTETENSHNNLNKLNFSPQKADGSFETVAKVKHVGTSSLLPSQIINKQLTLESQTIHYFPVSMATFQSQPNTASLPSSVNNFSTSDAAHSLHIQVNEDSCWQITDLNKRLSSDAVCDVTPISQNTIGVPDSNHDTQNNGLNSQENYPTTPLSSDKNIFWSTDPSSLVSTRVSSSSYEQNQMRLNQTVPNSNSQCYFDNWPYIQQLPDNQNIANVDSGFHLSDTHITTNQIYSSDNQQRNMPYLNLYLHDSLNNTDEYKFSVQQDNSYTCLSKDECSLDFNCDITTSRSSILIPRTSLPLDHKTNNLNCDKVYTDPLVTPEQHQNVCFSKKNDTCAILSTEQDTNYKCGVTEVQNIHTNGWTGKESSSFSSNFRVKINETPVKLTEYFSNDHQGNRTNEGFYTQNVATTLLPVTETLESILYCCSSHENSNLTEITESKAEKLKLYQVGGSNQSTVISKKGDHEYGSSSVTTETPNDSFDLRICNTRQSNINTCSSEHIYDTSEALLMSTFDELNCVKSERDNLSEHVSVLQKDLANAVANLTTYQKEAEMQTLNAEREKVAHQQALEAHQLTIVELNNTKAELVNVQKLVSELRQEVVSSKEEVSLLRAHEDENRSHYETEINSMKSIVKITSDHLSTLAESLQNALSEKAILQREFNHLKNMIHGQLQKFRLFTRLELYDESKIVNQFSVGSLAALGIYFENLVDGNSRINFHTKSPRKFNPCFESLRTEITKLENDLLSRNMLVSDSAQNK